MRATCDPDLPAEMDATYYDLNLPEEQKAAFVWDGDGNSLAHMRSSNPKLVYELRPNIRMNAFISTNAYGFRDHEYPLKKPDNVYRICVLGDSITFGWWERLEETYPKALERLLAENRTAGKKIEVLNMGIGGYNAEQELELFKSRVLAFEPDLTIIGYCANDNNIGADGGLWRHFTRGNSLAWDWFSLRLRGIGELFNPGTLVGRCYEQMATLAEPRGIDIMVVFFHTKQHSWVSKKLIGRDIAAVRELGLHALDLFPIFNQYDWNETMRDIFHPTALGHAIAAQAICDALLQENLLP